MTPEQKAVAIADKIVPAYRAAGSRYSCTGNVAKMWQAAHDGALNAVAAAADSSTTPTDQRSAEQADELLPVIQSDREQATRLAQWLGDAPRAFRDGAFDGHEFVQVFARHRLTSSAALIKGACICEVAFGQNPDCSEHGVGTTWRAANPQADWRDSPAAFVTAPKPKPAPVEAGEECEPAVWAVEAERASMDAYASYMGDPEGRDDTHAARRAAALEIERHAVAALTAAPKAPNGAGEITGWQCFHCGETFTDERCARLHFGRDEDSEPACVIKAGAEQGLLGALRAAEDAATDMRRALNEESTDSARHYYAQATRHRSALQSAEELGYERGLADGRALSTPPPSEGRAEVERLRIIGEAKRALRLVQGCLECNAEDERRWQETIEWLERLA